MANAVVNINPKLPAAIQKLMQVGGAESFNELAGGVMSSFPIISYRGKVWRIKKSGEEHDILNDEQEPVASIEVVLVKSNPMPSKIFYAKDYQEGSNDNPDCWSADGIKPDIGVQKPVCKTCAACPNNVWGSKIAQNGNKTKACQDARRMAVVSRQELEEKGADAPLYLLRVPPASLNPLKDFAEKVLKPKGIPYFAVTTKIGFDTAVAYPKMTFVAKRFLSDDEAESIMKLRDSEDAKRILAESEEYAAAGTPQDGEGSGAQDEDNTAPPAAASNGKKPTTAAKAKPRPAEEEDVGLDVDPPAAPPPATKKKQAAAPPTEEDGEIEAPPATAPPAGKKKAAAPPPVEEEGEEVAATPPPAAKKKAAAAAAKPAAGADQEEFEGMLDSILNS